MLTQDKVKGTQAKHAERVDWFMHTKACTIYPKKHNTDKINAWKHEMTQLSNANTHAVHYFSMQTITTKIQTGHKVHE